MTAATDRNNVDQRSASTEVNHVRLALLGTSAPRAASTLFRTSQHRSFLRNTLHSNNTRLSTASSSPDTQTNIPSSFNPSPEKRTATAFYVRLDRKPQVLRYVHRISPLRQAQINCLPAWTRSLGCPLPSLSAYVMVLPPSVHHVCWV